jgi:hypothetical protein
VSLVADTLDDELDPDDPDPDDRRHGRRDGDGTTRERR